MTNTRELIHSAGNASAITLYSEQVIPFLLQASWLLALPIIVVLTDCWFGISESRQRKEEIRFSGAGWKTLRKLLDYYTLLILGFVIGHILPDAIDFTVQETCFYFILFPTFFDLCSIIGHILKLKGVESNPKRFLVRLIIDLVKTKNSDVGNALEDSLDKEFNNKNNTKDNVSK